MAITAHEVRGMAKGFVEGIDKMPAKEREHLPTPHEVEAFNRLLDGAKQAAPKVSADAWPKPVKVNYNMGVPVPEARYAGLCIYARQILGLVPEELLPPMLG